MLLQVAAVPGWVAAARQPEMICFWVAVSPSRGTCARGRQEGSAWARALLAPETGGCSRGVARCFGGSELGHGEGLEQLPPPGRA